MKGCGIYIILVTLLMATGLGEMNANEKVTSDVLIRSQTLQKRRLEKQTRHLTEIHDRFLQINTEMSKLSSKNPKNIEKFKFVQKLGISSGELSMKLKENIILLQQMENSQSIKKDKRLKRETRKMRKTLDRMIHNLSKSLKSMERVKKRMLQAEN